MPHRPRSAEPPDQPDRKLARDAPQSLESPRLSGCGERSSPSVAAVPVFRMLTCVGIVIGPAGCWLWLRTYLRHHPVTHDTAEGS
jgi:hypothetical protein